MYITGAPSLPVLLPIELSLRAFFPCASPSRCLMATSFCAKETPPWSKDWRFSVEDHFLRGKTDLCVLCSSKRGLSIVKSQKQREEAKTQHPTKMILKWSWAIIQMIKRKAKCKGQVSIKHYWRCSNTKNIEWYVKYISLYMCTVRMSRVIKTQNGCKKRYQSNRIVDNQWSLYRATKPVVDLWLLFYSAWVLEF